MNGDNPEFDVHYEVDGQKMYQQAQPTPPPRRPIKIFTGDNLPIFILIGINVLMYLVELIMGGSSSNQVLYNLGAKWNLPIFYNGEYWRLLTSVFLHGGILHLACNMYALYNIGRVDIRLYGIPKFIAIYFVSGLMGSLFSYGFGEVNSLSVGASGAIFGLMGAAFYLYKEHPEVFKAVFGIRLGAVVLLNLVLGFSGGGIDNLAHIGGLLGGFGTAMMLGLYKDNKVRPLRILAAAVMVILAAVAFYVGALRTKAYVGGLL